VDDLTSPATLFAPAATLSRARRNIHGLWHPYLVIVPPGYDPTRRYPVRVYLQGDTTQPASSAESGGGWPNYDALARPDAIVVFPGAWNGFPWWDASQVEQIAAVLDETRRTYNVDENRVFLLGSSDGGSGVFYHAMVAATPFAGFLPFNADPSVLADSGAGVDAQLHAANVAGRPFYVVHGARDQIFPVASMAAWLGLFEAADAQVTFNVKPMVERGNTGHGSIHGGTPT
jgi:predicted peptidase